MNNAIMMVGAVVLFLAGYVAGRREERKSIMRTMARENLVFKARKPKEKA